ncbi:MAG: PD40 domain-containing protein [Cyclobacteriaceae bacterium]|nr:PD40 domain-containing protein [Cyclobacteriaceae bacterium]
MKRLLVAILALISFILFVNRGYAQSSKAVAEAEKYFNIRNYEEALPLFVQAIQAGEKDPNVHYKAGVCYQKSTSTDEQLKAIAYLEYALKNGAKVPVSTYYDLGMLYQRNEELQKAIDAYTQFKKASAADKKAVALADKAIGSCHNAVALMSVPRNVTVNSFGFGVNTTYTEYNPVVSADESILAFTALRPNTGKTRTGEKFIEEILISYNTSGTWSQPVVVPVTSDFNVGTAGISADGQKMMIFMGSATDPGNIFVINKTGDTWSKPTIFASTLNSKHLETTASITPDGKTIYFASDRLGGMGGMDIYKIELQANGNWSQPINLGPTINTKDNEDAPFIHPDQKTLFFTSDGHSTMGGRDIFMTKSVNNNWTKPENLGYPINTTANDNYFTLIADGTRAYFSSDRKGGQGAQDIYYIDMPEDAANIPLTMIKGRILNADTGKPMPTKIYVIDNQTNKKLDFVYDPDPETGNYLIILPPARNYDVIIESEGFLPYTINVNVPNQDYFYELFQQINLKTIKQFDVVVGQEVEVKNAFYNTNQDSKADLRKTHEAKLAQSGNVDVYDLMMDMLAAGDGEGVDYVLELIHLTNTMDQVNFDDSNPNLEIATRVYYYDETDEDKFEKKNVEGKTILSLPTFEVSEEAQKQKNQLAKKAGTYDKSVLAKQSKIYFDVAKSDLKAQYHASLDELLAILKKYPELGVEISGFASQEGSEEMNRELSNKRAIEVLNYLNHRDIVRRRIVAKGYGATKTETSKEEGRRVEVRIIDLQAEGSI